ncbi:hypothetical protein SLEP1_g21295 [Rubroshorea leprosula]|uniref:Uncharacterized protein n=1 Tax=Rubroshorea leprosula TaxID=152421 RepID=A0AAV5JBK2_9ROSI|nr:hypothetical protein SLEP1_g21295 [Rubroshorea leprosula]
MDLKGFSKEHPKMESAHLLQSPFLPLRPRTDSSFL